MEEGSLVLVVDKVILDRVKLLHVVHYLWSPMSPHQTQHSTRSVLSYVFFCVDMLNPSFFVASFPRFSSIVVHLPFLIFLFFQWVSNFP